jgi:para-aminobenzoate synthetase component 1
VARALRERAVPGVQLLESALDKDSLGRFSILVARPRVVAEAAPGRELVAGGRRLTGDPLDALARLLRELEPAGARDVARREGLPFAGGAVVAISYDYGRRLERLPARARADVSAPDVWAAVHDAALVFDHATGRVVHVRSGRGGLGLEEAEEAIARARVLRDPEPPPPLARGSLGGATSGFTPEGYRRAVARVRRYVRAGDVFQANLSQRFEAELRQDPADLHARLRALTPAPFMALLDLGQGRAVVSASPERFLSLDTSGVVETWPIKGTRPRGRTKREDARLRDALLASAKDRAELAMIVDMARNDLGRVAATGSVEVVDPRRLQSWPTVHHTVSVVRARLERGRAWSDLVRATFPPASVTGAPKVRALEILDELEPVRRGIYCGAIGRIGWDGSLELSVAIRTVWVERGRAFAHAGGGIVLASDPESERRETLAKARAILRALSARDRRRHVAAVAAAGGARA